MPICDYCTMDPCECASYGPGEIDYAFCEVCHEYPGVTNSRFLFDDEENPDVGVWICIMCEEVAEYSFHGTFPHPDDDPASIDPYYELDGEYEIEFGDRQWGDFVSPFIDEEREQ